MNREIKFRGKRIDNGEWVYGVPYFLNIIEEEPEDCVNKACIISWVDWSGSWGFVSPENRAFIEVIPETVGQYTGLKDKNGVKIYEGDLLHRYLGVYWQVVFEDSCWIAKSLKPTPLYLSGSQFIEAEVVGNIHSNP